MASNILCAAPCYYKGTSFEQIFQSLRHVVDEKKLPVEFYVGDVHDNDLADGLIDDDRYIHSQLKMIDNIIAQLEDGLYSGILFVDFFNPGLELLRYVKEGSKKIILGSLLHGGTFVSGDLFRDEWMSKAEELWWSLYDVVYVPSNYAYLQIPAMHKQKAKVFPWGVDGVESSRHTLAWECRDLDVVFPHRLSEDKGLDRFLSIAKIFKDVNFYITSPSDAYKSKNIASLTGLDNVKIITARNKDDLYKIFGRSKIVLSCSRQELFGYSVVEAYNAGCIPVLPRDQVYAEMYSDDYLYSSDEEALKKIISGLEIKTYNTVSKIETSFENMLIDFINLSKTNHSKDM